MYWSVTSGVGFYYVGARPSSVISLEPYPSGSPLFTIGPTGSTFGDIYTSFLDKGLTPQRAIARLYTDDSRSSLIASSYPFDITNCSSNFSSAPQFLLTISQMCLQCLCILWDVILPWLKLSGLEVNMHAPAGNLTIVNRWRSVYKSPSATDSDQYFYSNHKKRKEANVFHRIYWVHLLCCNVAIQWRK
jgi:hypothetical protein